MLALTALRFLKLQLLLTELKAKSILQIEVNLILTMHLAQWETAVAVIKSPGRGPPALYRGYKSTWSTIYLNFLVYFSKIFNLRISSGCS